MTSRQPLSAAAIRRLTLTTDPWLSCDDCFDDVDVVVEGVLGGASMSEAFRVHLLSCPVCREEAEALAELVAADHALAPDLAVVLLEGDLAGRPGGGW